MSDDEFRWWFLFNFKEIVAQTVADNGWGPWYQREAVNEVSSMPMTTLPSIVMDYLSDRYPVIGQIVPKEYVYRKPRPSNDLRSTRMPAV